MVQRSPEISASPEARAFSRTSSWTRRTSDCASDQKTLKSREIRTKPHVSPKALTPVFRGFKQGRCLWSTLCRELEKERGTRLEQLTQPGGEMAIEDQWILSTGETRLGKKR